MVLGLCTYLTSHWLRFECLIRMTMMVCGKISSAVPPLAVAGDAQQSKSQANRRRRHLRLRTPGSGNGKRLQPNPPPTLSSNRLTITASNRPFLCWNRSISKLRSRFNQCRAFLDSNHLESCCRAWTWAGWAIFMYLYSLCLGAKAVENPPLSISYPCEDAQDYYASAEHLTGEALRKQLNSIVRGHRSLSYKEVWNALEILDAAEVDQPEASPAIVEVYSLRIAPKQLAGKPEGWNREHLWPRSYGLTHGPSLTDLHNIRPADANVNSSRGNKYFGECHHDPSRFCLKPANKEAAPDTETDKRRWAPPTQVRGDIARAVMYMAVRYGFAESNDSPVLSLSNSPSMAKRQMGLLSALLKWNEVDPPSREEKLRNEKICRLYQHNRNPFVDLPEYANFIWAKPVSNHQMTQRNIEQGPTNSTTTMEVGTGNGIALVQGDHEDYRVIQVIKWDM
ncbi:Extracellular ribonuclease-like protein, partial [Drosera capensis]